MNKKAYRAMIAWVEKKTMKNFFRLYLDGFTIRFWWCCPLWRVWRIIRNTVTGRYTEIVNDKTIQKEYGE